MSESKTYSIFGAGPSGLYTAWRLVNGGTLNRGDKIHLYEWGNYDLTDSGTGRPPAGRICSHHYKSKKDNGYIEIGGMRFLEWNNEKSSGHQLVSKTIEMVGLQGDVVDFETTDNPLFYLRGVHFYQEQLGKPGPDGNEVLAPYNTPGNNAKPADALFSNISSLITGPNKLETRSQQCEFYASGTLPNAFNSFVYRGGETVGNLGYWNIFYDQAGNEGFNYAADAGGYSSNVINWNAADAAIYNGEFAPGGSFKTLKHGYSSLFSQLYQKAVESAKENGIVLELKQQTRLHSIWLQGDATRFRLATAADPHRPQPEELTTDYAFLAMPPESVELVAQATRYSLPQDGTTDFLNNPNFLNQLESVIKQPSYKIAMFFDRPWWNDEEVSYPPKLTNKNSSTNVFGPTITDLPLRQVYYFGDNSTAASAEPVYGLLASYDDMRFIDFWRVLERGVDQRREVAISQDTQPLNGGSPATPEMAKMLRLQLAKLHYGDPNAAYKIPEPLETVYIDWGLNPFGAGYHAWAAHYNIAEVMQDIRTPARALTGNATIFLVGSAFSNDQAWVEGAFCTSESVLVDYLKVPTIANTTNYPLICGGASCGS